MAKKKKSGAEKFPFDKSKYPYVSKGHQYALDIVAGKIPACIYVIGACKRYLNDLNPNDRFYFDPDKAEKYLRLVQKFTHVVGNWDSDNIIYEPWQCFVFMNIMGFVSKVTGERRYRTAHVEIPRGNTKTTMASQGALYFLSLDNPKGNKISCVATKKDQARLVLDSARDMAKSNKSFLKATGTRVLAHKIIHEKSSSEVSALSSQTDSNDGRFDILSIVDELHAIDSKTFEVVDSGMSKRNDSLLLCITTAGYDVEGVGFSQSAYAKKVSSGELEDDLFFAIVYTIDKDDDIYDPKTWIKANPNWGVSVDSENLKSKAKKALESPRDLANFKIKHLNIWLSEAQAFFNMEAWDRCADKTLSLEDFKGYKCFLGVDLASKIDLTAIAYVFKKDGIYYIFDKSFIPEERVKEVRKPLYEKCIQSGDLIATPGEAINYQKIKEEILSDKAKFNIKELMYDPWNATEFSQSLTKERLECVEFRMNTSNLSEPTKSLDALIREGKVRHNGSPLLRWCLSNVVCKEDAADNVFPKKSHEKLKIDPVIAIIMGLAGWTQQEETESVYESRGIRFI
jgi:phage terminase large subunit-like protein